MSTPTGYDAQGRSYWDPTTGTWVTPPTGAVPMGVPEGSSPTGAVPAPPTITPIGQGAQAAPGWSAPPPTGPGGPGVQVPAITPVGAGAGGPAPMSPAAKRRLAAWLGVVVLLLVAVAAGLVAVNALNARRSPEAAVEAYVGLISQGHGDAATASVDPGVPNDSRKLLTDAALGAATNRVELVDAEREDSDGSDRGDDVKVTATLSVGGQHVTHEFTVRRGKPEHMVLRTWEVEDALVVPLSVDAEGLDSVNVAGVQVPVSGGQTYYVYPGTYEVSAPQGSTYVSAESQTVTASGDRPADVSLQVEPSDALRDLVLAAVKDQITTCASVPGNMESQCPYRVRQTDLASLKVTHVPTTLEDLSLSGFTADEGVITIVSLPSTWDPNPDPEDVDVVFRGTIDLTSPDKPAISMTSSW